MPVLNWLGKDKIINHHQDVPFRVLEHSYTHGTAESGNMIIHGDNLDALKALLPRYEGRVKCIYIDPPYNTGNEGWVYNDNVNDPRIKKWLGETVGKEGEDLSRHDKWLCMMYPRLRLLQRLLADDGVLLVSLDGNEYHNFMSIADEIMGINNRIGTIIWKNATDNNPTTIVTEHEYIISYAKNKSYIASEWKSADIAIKLRLLEIEQDLIEQCKNENELQAEYTKWYKAHKNELWPFQDYKFMDRGGIFTGSRSVHNPGKEGYRYDVLHPITKKPCTQPLMGYRFPEETMRSLLDEGKIIFGKDDTKLIELKVYARDYRAKLASVIELDGRKGANELKSIFPESVKLFDHPKTVELLEEVFSFITSGGDIILDSFAGSGTTAHAVLNMNKADGGKRKFILIEMMDYAEIITAERVRRVIDGYGNVPGTGGSFDYYELGEPLLFADGNLNENVSDEKIYEYIWYTETKTAYEPQEAQYYLGTSSDTAYYFNYERDEITELNEDFLRKLTVKAERYIIYADMCALSASDLASFNIIFKKIPRDISRL
jgi:DNA modification methylase